MKEVPESDSELLHAMKAGNEEAFRTIYSRLQGQAFRFALHMTGSRSLAEDVVQETFLTLIQKSEGFDSGKGSLAAFVLGIVRNCVLRRLKNEASFVSLAGTEAEAARDRREPAAESNPLTELGRSETVKRVRDAVLSLPIHYREVVVLCELEEKSYEEAAECLGCSPGTVRSRLHRARALLLAKLRATQNGPDLLKAGSRRCLA